MNRNILWLKETDSTNEYVKRKLKAKEKIENKRCFFSEFQTSGRGQRGAVWESEKGLNLTFSCYYKPTGLKIEQMILLNKAIALLLLDYCSTYRLPDLKIKWPNDIYVGNEKLAGILIENTLVGTEIYESVIGVGLNVNQVRFNLEETRATSLSKILNQRFDLKELSISIANFFDQIDRYLKDTKCLEERYLLNMYRYNVQADFVDEQGFFTGKITGVDEQGKLMIELKNGALRKYEPKQVKFITTS